MLCAALYAGTAAHALDPVTHGFNVADMDTSANPCDDFYQYANGHWLATHPIPAEFGQMSTGLEVYLRNEAIISQILKDAARDSASGRAAKGSVRRKVGDFFRSGMD